MLSWKSCSSMLSPRNSLATKSLNSYQSIEWRLLMFKQIPTHLARGSGSEVSS